MHRARCFHNVIVATLLLFLVSGLSKQALGGDSYEDFFQSMKARQAEVETQLMGAGHCLGEGLNGLLKINANCSPEAKALAEAENRDRQALFKLMSTQLGISAEQVGQERAKQNLDRYLQGIQREVELSIGKTTWWDGSPPDPRETTDPRPPLPSDPDLFAVIEIGASGIKPAILQVIYNNIDDRYVVNEKKPNRKLETRKYDIITLEANNRGAFHPDSIKYIAEDLEAYVNSFVNENRVPRNHIYIVGSSSVAEAGHRHELQYAVQGSTGIPMDFVTPEQEARYAFEGALKLIPKERGQQDLRRTQAVVIDIGSGNTKGGYYNTSTGRIDTFEVKYGTKTFSKMVDEQRGNKVFSEAAQYLRDQEIRPIIRSETSRLPGLLNKQRVYLIGGIPWAVSTLLSLDSPAYAERSATHDQEIYTVMNFRAQSDVDRLYNRAIGAKATELICAQNVDINSITDPKKQEKRIRDVNNICNGIFSIYQLIGGMEIIKAFSQELRFPDKQVFFIQNALYAWPLGYIQDKIQNVEHRK